MKLLPAHFLIPVALLFVTAVASFTMAQTAPPAPAPTTAPTAAVVPAPPDPAVAALIQQLLQQQAQMAENQTQIETKMAALAEEIRQARIFARRGGGGGGAGN